MEKEKKQKFQVPEMRPYTIILSRDDSTVNVPNLGWQLVNEPNGTAHWEFKVPEGVLRMLLDPESKEYTTYRVVSFPSPEEWEKMKAECDIRLTDVESVPVRILRHVAYTMAGGEMRKAPKGVIRPDEFFSDIVSHLFLAQKVASRYYLNGFEQKNKDLVCSAILGLVEARVEYTGNHGKFFAYAIRRMAKQVHKCIGFEKAVTLPNYKRVRLIKVNRAISLLEAEGIPRRSITPGKLNKRFYRKPKKAVVFDGISFDDQLKAELEALADSMVQAIVESEPEFTLDFKVTPELIEGVTQESLDKEVGGEESTAKVGDFIQSHYPDPLRKIEQRERREIIEGYFEYLFTKEKGSTYYRMVVELADGLKKQSEIAKGCGYTESYVSQEKPIIIERVREVLEKFEDDEFWDVAAEEIGYHF